MKENLKKSCLFAGGLLIFMFVTVYVMSLTGYYDSVEENRKTLTTEAISRFEKDVLNGQVIVASNYVEEKENYDNLLSRIGIKIGNIIELIFKKVINSILKEIEGAIQ